MVIRTKVPKVSIPTKKKEIIKLQQTSGTFAGKPGEPIGEPSFFEDGKEVTIASRPETLIGSTTIPADAAILDTEQGTKIRLTKEQGQQLGLLPPDPLEQAKAKITAEPQTSVKTQISPIAEQMPRESFSERFVRETELTPEKKAQLVGATAGLAGGTAALRALPSLKNFISKFVTIKPRTTSSFQAVGKAFKPVNAGEVAPNSKSTGLITAFLSSPLFKLGLVAAGFATAVVSDAVFRGFIQEETDQQIGFAFSRAIQDGDIARAQEILNAEREFRDSIPIIQSQLPFQRSINALNQYLKTTDKLRKARADALQDLVQQQEVRESLTPEQMQALVQLAKQEFLISQGIKAATGGE